MFVFFVKVRFRDLDAMNHVNNAVYLSYLEDARIAMMETMGVSGMMTRERSWILARTEIDYRFPAVMGDTLRVTVGLGELRNSSLELRYRIERESDGRLVADARSVQVCYNYAQGHATRVPNEWRERLANLNQSSPK